MRRIVVGDMHGAFRALKQCIERSGIDKEKDQLICLGDVADGWPEVKECFDELLSFKNLIFILGNHDQWLLEWVKGKHPGNVWSDQGGFATQISYLNHQSNVPQAHVDLLKGAHIIYLDEKNRLFVHGGINRILPIEKQEEDTCLWDRDLVKLAVKCHLRKRDIKRITKFEEVFVGHTTTTSGYVYGSYKGTEPVNLFEIWCLDTGAGWSGVLTFMDIDTKETWQSDFVRNLYPEIERR